MPLGRGARGKTPDEPDIPAVEPRNLPGFSGRQLLRRVVGLAVPFGVVVVVIATVPGLRDVRRQFAQADGGWIAATCCLELLSCLSFVAAFHAVTERRLARRVAYHLAMTEQAANVVVPTGGAGGLAVVAFVLQRAGLPGDRVAARMVALFLLTSAASFVALIVAGVLLAAGVFAVDLPLAAGLAPAAAAAAAIVVVLALPRLISAPAPDSAGRLRAVASSAVRALLTGIQESVRLLARRDLGLVAGCVGYLAFDILALAAAFAAFGGGAPPASAFVVAYILGQLGALIPLPGGIGGTDGGLIGFFVVYGATASAATAAVLAFRVFQLGLPTALGAIAISRLRADMRLLQTRTQPVTRSG